MENREILLYFDILALSKCILYFDILLVFRILILKFSRFRSQSGAESAWLEVSFPSALESKTDPHEAKEAAVLAIREFIEIFIRKNETSHKFRKFLAFSELF